MSGFSELEEGTISAADEHRAPSAMCAPNRGSGLKLRAIGKSLSLNSRSLVTLQERESDVWIKGKERDRKKHVT